MPPIKFQDVREVTITIPNGSSNAFVEFNPGITDQDGVAVSADSVISEFVNAVGDILWPASKLESRISATALRIYVLKAVNATGFDQVYTLRVTSLRWHSIQGADHTI